MNMYSGDVESYGSISSYASMINTMHQNIPSHMSRGMSPALWTSSVSVVNPGTGGMYMTSYTAYNTGWSAEQGTWNQTGAGYMPGQEHRMYCEPGAIPQSIIQPQGNKP